MYQTTEWDKYQIYLEVKQPKKPFKLVERQKGLLELIHSDLGDFKIFVS